MVAQVNFPVDGGFISVDAGFLSSSLVSSRQNLDLDIQ